MPKVKVLVVEDEILVAESIAAVLKKHDFEVCDIADSAGEALRLFTIHQPDIVLLDIKIKGEHDGIYVAGKIRQENPIPLIFLTSLVDQTTVEKARETKPSAYMVKPFNESELKIAIEMAIYNYANNKVATSTADQVQESSEDGHYLVNEGIFVKNNFRFEKVSFSDINWLEADNNYARIVTADKKYLLTLTLGALHDKLQDPTFLRVHRSYAINMEKVEAFEGNHLFVDGTQIPISRGYKEDVLRHFRII